MNALIIMLVFGVIAIAVTPIALPIAYIAYRVNGGEIGFWKFVWNL